MERTAGCNMVFWKKDVVRILGFNEDRVGWGAEDKELTVRLLGQGVQMVFIEIHYRGGAFAPP